MRWTEPRGIENGVKRTEQPGDCTHALWSLDKTRVSMNQGQTKEGESDLSYNVRWTESRGIENEVKRTEQPGDCTRRLEK